MPATRFLVTGLVQGVGFRYFVQREARRLHLRGWVRNRADGSVEALAAGSARALAAFAEALRQGPPAARVERVTATPAEEAATAAAAARGEFVVAPSA